MFDVASVYVCWVEKQNSHLTEPDNLRNSPIHASHQVYCNSDVNLREMDVIGFDFDYTIASYTDSLLELVYQQALDSLVDQFGYPEELKANSYDPSFAIRGITVDRQKALLMKVSSFNRISVGSVFKGRRRLTNEEILKEYDGTRFVSFKYREEAMAPLTDLFTLPHACLLADVVEHFEKNGIVYEPESVVLVSNMARWAAISTLSL